MRRRNVITLSVLILLSILIGGGYLAVRYAQSRATLVQEAIQIGLAEMNKQINETTTGKNQVEVRFNATLDGETTSLTATIINHTSDIALDVVLNQLTLGKIEPDEKAQLPLRVSSIAPGASREVLFHFQKVPWNLAGDDSAKAELVQSHEWTATVNKGTRTITVRGTPVEVRFGNWSYSHTDTGIGQIDLDKASARALKKLRATASKPASAEKSKPCGV